MFKVQGKITDIQRGNSSLNGNPRFKVTIETLDVISGDLTGYRHTFSTAPDSVVAYAIHSGMVGLTVTLTLNGRDNITNLETDSVL